MTTDFFRHVHPDRTLIVDMGERGRGPFDASGYTTGRPGADVWVNQGYNDEIPEGLVREFCGGLDVVYAAETFYREDVASIMRSCGVRTVLHVMPELYRHGDAKPDVLWVPTPWRMDMVPRETVVVPVPVDTVRFAPGPPSRRIVHISAPAFHDRNGSDLVRQALGHMSVEVELIAAGQPIEIPPCRVRPTVTHRPPSQTRQEVYAGGGALLLPRRYAGLSLPMQEAAAMGWPIVTLDLSPQNQWVSPSTLVPAVTGADVRTVGGFVNVAEANPRVIANRVSALVSDPEMWARASAASLAHADEISWTVWASRYRGLLEAVCA